MIFVFSGTGNSYSVARRLADGMSLPLVDIPPAVRYGRLSYDARGEDVGFVFPVHFCGLPAMVEEFARGLTVSNPGRVFAVATCGGASVGAAESLREALDGRLEVDASYDVLMPDNAVFLLDPPTAEEAAAILAEADAEVESIAASLERGESGDFRRHAGDADWRSVHGRYGGYRSTEAFHLNGRCIECRMCEEFCPDGTIVVYHRKPVWDREECTLCMACVQMCPKAAVEYGDATESRGRYYNPAFYERTIGIRPRYGRHRNTRARIADAWAETLSERGRTCPGGR